MNNLPNRHRNHEIESLSDRYFRNFVPPSWVVNTFHIDYGTDLNCEIALNKQVTGMNFTVQLKGKEIESHSENVILNIKRSTINRWQNRLEPTMIVAYVIDENEAYWDWFEIKNINLTLPNERYSIKISKNNRISSIIWENVINYVKSVFSKKHLLYSLPQFNNQNEIAWKLYFEGSFDKALVIFYDLIEGNHKDSLIYEAIAISEYTLFNYQKALININKALEISKNDSFLKNKAAILTEQGSLSKDQNKIKEAIIIYKKLIQTIKDSDILYYNLASALFILKDYKDATIFFEKSLNINPNKPEVWNNLGNLYMEVEDHTNEIICYDNALTINPNLPETLFSKGSSLFKNFGLVDQGLELMLKSASLTDRYELDNPYFFFWISEAYLSKSDFQNCSEWNTKGLSFFSTDSFLLNQKQRLEIQLNNQQL